MSTVIGPQRKLSAREVILAGLPTSDQTTAGMSHQGLMALTGFSRTTTERRVNELVREGLVKRVGLNSYRRAS